MGGRFYDALQEHDMIVKHIEEKKLKKPRKLYLLIEKYTTISVEKYTPRCRTTCITKAAAINNKLDVRRLISPLAQHVQFQNKKLRCS